MKTSSSRIEFAAIILALTLVQTIDGATQKTSEVIAKEDGNKNNATSSLTEARSMDQSAKSTTRGGRMLDLDHLAGDIGKDEKLAKERSLSGQRQSRILNDDLPIEAATSSTANKLDARSRTAQKSKAKKKMTISGFIPIVSLEAAKEGKHFENPMDESEHQETGEAEQETSGDGDRYSPDAEGNTKNQLISSFGGQTSLGHASFAPQQTASNEQQLSSRWQQMQQAAANQQLVDQQLETGDRANRKLLGGGGLLGNLAQPTRLMSSLIRQPNQLQPQFIQGPMNLPLGANQMSPNGDSMGGECICVPFFQCKNGYLSESQLSRSQLQQFVGFAAQQSTPIALGANQHQVPRSLSSHANFQPQPQQMPNPNDLYYAQQSQQQPISSLASQMSGQMMAQGGTKVQGNEQQLANDIYEQLRKSIESEQLEQQLQQQQQQQFAANYQPLDERSKAGGQQQNSSSSQQEEVFERSLLNPLGRRSGSQSAGRSCGIMRTCCKVPPSLTHHSMRQPQHNGRLVGQLHPSHNQMPRYQLLQAATQAPQPPAHLAPSHQQRPFQQLTPDGQSDYLAATSAQIPAQLTQQPPRPMGSFMAGRCGLKQTIGISGRVQNTQPAPGSETTAEFGEFPSHVAILKRISPGDSLFVCSAVLISNQWVATAAHCVRRHRAEELKLRLGEWDVNRDDEFYPFVESNVRQIIVHPDFQPSSLINDVALLRLELPVDPQQMPHISPACLPEPDELFEQQRCWVAGWGKDAFGQGGAFQSVLKKVDLPVVGRQDCESALRYQTKLGKFFRLHQSAICAGGERGKDACEGDGGAGLYCSDPESGLTKVAGLVSWGVGCGQRGVPGVYSNLAAFYRWVESVVAASGEESLYLDRNAQDSLANSFKNLISERSNGAAPNSTIISAADATTNSTNLKATENNSTTDSSASSADADGNEDLESRAG